MVAVRSLLAGQTSVANRMIRVAGAARRTRRRLRIIATATRPEGSGTEREQKHTRSEAPQIHAKTIAFLATECPRPVLSGQRELILSRRGAAARQRLHFGRAWSGEVCDQTATGSARFEQGSWRSCSARTSPSARAVEIRHVNQRRP